MIVSMNTLHECALKGMLLQPVFPKTRFSIMLSQASLFRFYRSGVQLFPDITFTIPAVSSIRLLLRC